MKRTIASLQGEVFDLLICGGGVYGAWTAYDAALRGLKVAIIEQNDWGAATSSTSSKLIHGGLRYLESYDFGLVKKSLSEREMLQKIAPYRIWPLRFGVPVYANSRIGSFRLKLALIIYDWLGKTCQSFRHESLKHTTFSNRFPFLKKSQLKAGFVYTDAQTDDARLVLELISGAINVGAICVNYCKATRQLEQNGKIYGVKAHDQVANTDFEIQARQIVFTTGPWLSTDKTSQDWCRLAKGVHLIMPALPNHEEALLLTAESDGRVFFMIPWYGRTILGTTDTNYHDDINQIVAQEVDITYLLNAANHYLSAAWTKADIIGCYAGTRVLKQSEQSDPSSVSRDWALKTAENGVHYSIGGKLTSARQDAAHIVDQVCAQLHITTRCTTLTHDFPWMPEDDEYTTWQHQMTSQAIQAGIDHESTKWLIRRHGKNTIEIISTVQKQPDLSQRIVPALPFIFADLLYCAQHEMVIHLSDLLRRRMPLLILAQLSREDLHRIAINVAPVLNWCDAAITEEVNHSLNSNLASNFIHKPLTH